jgi:alpha-L-arabinofuranosidase
MAPSIHIDPARHVAPVDPRIYSGFTEHMGRCIYGGLYDPDNAHGLADANGYRTDVLQALKDLNISIVRYPGGWVHPFMNLVFSLTGPQQLRELVSVARRVYLAACSD